MEQMGLVKLKNLNELMGEALGFYNLPIHWIYPWYSIPRVRGGAPPVMFVGL